MPLSLRRHVSYSQSITLENQYLTFVLLIVLHCVCSYVGETRCLCHALVVMELVYVEALAADEIDPAREAALPLHQYYELL